MSTSADAEVFRREKASLERLEAFRSLRLRPVTWGRTDCGPQWSRDHAFHKTSSEDIHVVLFPIAGRAWYESDGVRIEMRPGSVYWTPPSKGNLPFSRGCPEFFSHFYLAFHYEMIDGINLLENWQAPAKIGEWDVERDAEHWEPNSLSLPNAWIITATVEAALIRHCGHRLEEAIEAQYRTQSHLGNVFTYIEEHLSASLRVEDLNEVACLSRSAFTRNFTRIIGLSPKAYLNLLLTRKACSLLLQTSLSVKEVSEQLEFENENYFNRFFSKQTGFPPGRYRAHAKEKWQ
ncbi:MAG: helix-turn-helix transcriptional regulator [Verrucomicrobia bacterium]|nr:helix-turn-helix transcriptional regulator [Verrucomicrobiota bacterium]MCH8527687.1 AraC family transcriptional regulator [Kiritimatiellia bacterium]